MEKCDKFCYDKLTTTFNPSFMEWVREPQEQEGDYMFSGNPRMTRGVAEELPQHEILDIILDIHARVKENNGLDYLQVYSHPDKSEQIFCIAQISESMKQSGGYTPEQIKEYDTWTIMFNHEY